jgi:hypothetical protein
LCDDGNLRIDVIHRNRTRWSDPALSKSWVNVPVPLRGFKPSLAPTTRRWLRTTPEAGSATSSSGTCGAAVAGAGTPRGAAPPPTRRRRDRTDCWCGPTAPPLRDVRIGDRAGAGRHPLPGPERGVIAHPIHIAVKDACKTMEGTGDSHRRQGPAQLHPMRREVQVEPSGRRRRDHVGQPLVRMATGSGATASRAPPPRGASLTRRVGTGWLPGRLGHVEVVPRVRPARGSLRRP